MSDSTLNQIYLRLSWSGNKYDLSLHEGDTVGDLKQIVWSLTNVPPFRQKLLGLGRPGKQLSLNDEVLLSELGLKAGSKVKDFMMVGTPEGAELQQGTAALGGPLEEEVEIADADYTATEIADFKAAQIIRNRRKIQEASDALKINLMRPLRPGKKLLVLDLDYAILDTQRWKEQNFNARDFARPYLHELLLAISPHYDIAVWSQTSWRWLESKLIECGLIGDPDRDYSICFVLDRTSMFPVYSERNGKPFKHEVKALEVIWKQFSWYNETNTIHVDDLSRNFAMNPKNGLKVTAYKDSKVKKATDRELLDVKRYLLQISLLPSWVGLNHKHFKTFVGPLPSES